MRKLLPISLVFLPMIAGCLAVAGETATRPNAIQFTWETLLTIYGPMAVWLIWFIRRDDLRRKEDAEHRKEWTDLVKECTETMTQVKEALTLTHADDEKHRTAIYRLVEEVRDIGVIVRGSGSGNTRIITRDNSH